MGNEFYEFLYEYLDLLVKMFPFMLFASICFATYRCKQRAKERKKMEQEEREEKEK